MLKKIIISVLLIICTSLLVVGDKYYKEKQTVKDENAKLYELAFDSFWELETGITVGVKYVSINTKTFKGISDEDKKRLFAYIEEKYKLTVLDMSFAELRAAGYIIEPAKDGFYHKFVNGILIEGEKYNSYSSDSVSFEGKVYRRALGEIGFHFEAVRKNKKWQLKECYRTWMS